MINRIRENASKNSKNSYDELFKYFNRQGINTEILEKPRQWEQPFYAEMLGKHGVICTVNVTIQRKTSKSRKKSLTGFF